MAGAIEKGLTMSEGKAGGRVARELPGLQRDLLEKILGENGEEWLDPLKLFLHKKNPWPEAPAKPRKRRLRVLQPLEETVEFPGIAEFRAADHLRITPQDERETAELVIGFLGDNVKNNFLADGGKIETDIHPSILRANRLKKGSVDKPIIADLGGETMAETTLAEMIELMRRQGRGQQGILLTNGYANIFYIRDAKGVFWAVSCYWGGSYWYVRANSVTAPDEWHADGQVFARDSGS